MRRIAPNCAELRAVAHRLELDDEQLEALDGGVALLVDRLVHLVQHRQLDLVARQPELRRREPLRHVGDRLLRKPEERRLPHHRKLLVHARDVAPRELVLEGDGELDRLAAALGVVVVAAGARRDRPLVGAVVVLHPGVVRRRRAVRAPAVLEVDEVAREDEEVVVQPHEVAPALERPLRPHVDRAGEAVLDEPELGGLERVPRQREEQDRDERDDGAAGAARPAPDFFAAFLHRRESRSAAAILADAADYQSDLLEVPRDP